MPLLRLSRGIMVAMALLAACTAEYDPDPPLTNLRLRMEADTSSPQVSGDVRFAVAYQLRGGRRFPIQRLNETTPWQLVRRLQTGDTLLLWGRNAAAADLLPDSLQALGPQQQDSAVAALNLQTVSLPFRIEIQDEQENVLASTSTEALDDSIGLRLVIPEP